MTKPILIAPSILSADFANLQREIETVSKAGADWIHVDVMDGHFVPNLTIGAPVVTKLKPISPIPLDVHLMIENPEKYVGDFLAAKSDIITIHVESTKDVTGCLQKIRSGGAKAGITLRPATPVESLFPFLSEADLVLIMTVNPGFGGQSFMKDQVAKIRTVRNYCDEKKLSPWIEVDGGINAETGRECIQAGANVLVAGNFVFRNNYAEAIAQLKG